MFLSPLLAMHIPDGFVNLPVAAVGWLVMIALIGLTLRRTRGQLAERQIPVMGVLAAFVFSAQMINFPVAGGTSGHLLGGALVAILLGPWQAALVMTTVITVQGLLFQDGGLLALGPNVLNMGICAAFVGHAVYTWIRKLLGDSPRTSLIAAGSAAWLTVVIGAAATALELSLSGTVTLPVALPAMLAVHAIIGLGEALITVGALAFIRQTRPDLLQQTGPVARGSAWIAVGLLIALAIAFASPLASSHPDGLERVALDQHFLDKAKVSSFNILPDYTVPGIHGEAATTIAAAFIGVIVVTGTGYAVGRLATRQHAQHQQDTA